MVVRIGFHTYIQIYFGYMGQGGRNREPMDTVIMPLS